MRIKEQITDLLKQYKEHFEQETGLGIIILLDTAIPTIPLQQLGTLICDFAEIDFEEFKTRRTGEVIVYKTFFYGIAKKMGYLDRVMADFFEMERSSITYYKNKFNHDFSFDNFKLEFFKCIEYINLNSTGILPEKIGRQNFFIKKEIFTEIFNEI